MARMPRFYAAGFAQLVAIQFRSQSESENLIFNDPLFRELLLWIGDAVPREGVRLHGWSLTPRGIYLLATPSHEKSIPKLVQSLGRNLAAALKIGTVFSGRYHAMIPQPTRWVLPALIWLERQPVREGLTEDPVDWPWSSARAHTGISGIPPKWFHPHPDYWACGNTPFDRQAVYRRQLLEGSSQAIEHQIQACLRSQWALGETSFLIDLEKVTQRRVSPGVRGRPRKSAPQTAN